MYRCVIRRCRVLVADGGGVLEGDVVVSREWAEGVVVGFAGVLGCGQGGHGLRGRV